MPNPKTIRQERYKIFLKLPNDLKTAMFSVESVEKIKKIAVKNALNENQLHWTSHTVGMILLGEINIVDFVRTLEEKCGLERQTARALARDINQEIFLPIKESLKRIHNVPEWPREDETSQSEIPKPKPVQEETSPHLEGNIVDLKQ